MSSDLSRDQAFSGLQTAYSNARPHYPDAALRHIQSMIAASSDGAAPTGIVDVGCGTGILTRQLADIWPETAILGVDINEEMIAKAEATTDLERVTYMVSSADDLPVISHTARMIFAAQAVQWFDRPGFYAECRRVLEQEGWVCLVENNRSWWSDEMLDAYEGLLERYSPNYSRYYRSHDYVQELEAAGFAKLSKASFPWKRQMKAPLFVEMTRSSTKMQAALKASGSEVSSDVGRLVDQHVDQSGYLHVSYETVVIMGCIAE